MIKIAQILSKGANGGVESIVFNYYKYIDKTKFQFDFFIENESQIINKDNVGKLGGSVFLIPSYYRIFDYKKQLSTLFLLNKYDIVHSNISTMSFLPLSIAKRVGINHRIAHSHSTGTRVEIIKTIAKKVLRYPSNCYATDFFACGNAAAIFQFGRKAVNSGKVFVLNNAIDYSRFGFNRDYRDTVRKKYNVLPNEILLGFIGRIVHQKNPLFFISLMRELIGKGFLQYKMMIIGNGDMLEELKQSISTEGLSKYFVFVNSTKNPEYFYSAFDIFLLPSFYEGLPVVALEAQANGLPCLFSNNITGESRISPKTKFISLNKKDEWINNIISISHQTRINSNILDSKFDISKQVLVLQRKYLEILSK